MRPLPGHCPSLPWATFFRRLLTSLRTGCSRGEQQLGRCRDFTHQCSLLGPIPRRTGGIELTTPVVVTGFVLDPQRARPPTKVDDTGMLLVSARLGEATAFLLWWNRCGMLAAACAGSGHGTCRGPTQRLPLQAAHAVHSCPATMFPSPLRLQFALQAPDQADRLPAQLAQSWQAAYDQGSEKIVQVSAAQWWRWRAGKRGGGGEARAAGR